MSDTPLGETVNVEPPKNDVTPVVTPAPAPVKTDDAAVEQLRKELEQAKMRTNQLENEKKQREDAQAAADAKELEDQNQFKSLYEQEKAKREGLETEAQQKERTAELAKAKQEVLKDYSDDVKALADEVGLDLTGADEAAVASFKEKLEKINTRVASTGKVTGNNRPNAAAAPALSGEELRVALMDDDKFHELAMKMPGIAAMTTPRKV